MGGYYRAALAVRVQSVRVIGQACLRFTSAGKPAFVSLRRAGGELAFRSTYFIAVTNAAPSLGLGKPAFVRLQRPSAGDHIKRKSQGFCFDFWLRFVPAHELSPLDSDVRVYYYKTVAFLNLPATTRNHMSEHRRQLFDVLTDEPRLSNYSPKTTSAYKSSIKSCARHFSRTRCEGGYLSDPTAEEIFKQAIGNGTDEREKLN